MPAPSYAGANATKERHMTNENKDAELPFVVTYDVGVLPQNGVAIRLTYATSAMNHAVL